jgi:hypothetical protein
MRHALVLLLACHAPTAVPPANASRTPPTLPTEPAEAAPILANMNAWCAEVGGDCDVAENPAAHPHQVAAGETNGWIASHREQLRAYGVDVVWDGRAFESVVDHDLQLIIGGSFGIDHLGPEVYGAVATRAKARAALYLGELVAHVSRDDARWLSATFVPSAVALVHDVDPASARVAAQQLLPRFVAALHASGDGQADRLRARVAELEELAR